MKQIILICMVLCCVAAQASDLAREARLAEQIIDAIIDGDPVMLRSGDHEFLSIYTEAETTAEHPRAHGAAIILHGRGFHPNWADVVLPLRVGLTEYGWNTLSMQMPVLEKEAKFYDYVPIFSEAGPRIDAGIEYLRARLEGQDKTKIVLIAHSCSVHMVMEWIDAGKMHGIDALVGIGMGATDYRQPMAKPFPLDKISLPVLDVYGADDYPAVQRGAPQRLAMMKQAGNPRSAQIVVLEANHYFTEMGDELLDTILAWLNTL